MHENELNRYEVVTEPSITNSKGVEIKPGDLVVTKGSKIVRKVGSVWKGKVNGTRIDGSIIASSAWLDPEKLTVVEPAAEAAVAAEYEALADPATEPELTDDEKAEADEALAALEAVAARQDKAASDAAFYLTNPEQVAARKAELAARQDKADTFDSRFEGGTITRHYYAVRIHHYDRGEEFPTYGQAVDRALEHLAKIERGDFGDHAPARVQIDTRITVKLVGGGSEDFVIDKSAVTPDTRARR